MVDNQQAIIESTTKSDRVSKTKTLYDASTFEIFWRNFLAGVSRALGGIVLYVLVILVFGVIISKYVLPLLSPFINNLQGVFKSIESIQPYKVPSNFSLPGNLPSLN